MKTAGLRIRVEPALRQSFVEACQANDQSAAQVLRAFMREYVSAIEHGKQGNLFAQEETAQYVATKPLLRK